MIPTMIFSKSDLVTFDKIKSLTPPFDPVYILDSSSIYNIYTNCSKLPSLTYVTADNVMEIL